MTDRQASPGMTEEEAVRLARRISETPGIDGKRRLRARVDLGWRAYCVEVEAVDPATGRWQDGALWGADVYLAVFYTPEQWDARREEIMMRASLTVTERRQRDRRHEH